MRVNKSLMKTRGAAAVMTALVVGGVAAASHGAAQRSQAGPAVHPSRLQTAVGAAPAHVTAATACGGALSVPSWAPASVSSRSIACAAPGVQPTGQGVAGQLGGSSTATATALGPGVSEVTYRLSGAANADAAPQGNEPWDQAKLKAGFYHGGTTIEYIVYSGTTQLQESLADSGNIVKALVLSNGTVARTTVPQDGLGGMRVEWTAHGNAYLLLSARGTTPDGPSGPTLNELVAMAGSTA